MRASAGGVILVLRTGDQLQAHAVVARDGVHPAEQPSAGRDEIDTIIALELAQPVG